MKQSLRKVGIISFAFLLIQAAAIIVFGILSVNNVAGINEIFTREIVFAIFGTFLALDSILILFCQKGEKIRLNNYLIVVEN